MADRANQGLSEGWPARGLPRAAIPAPVPGVWNTVDPDFRGAGWYETEFHLPASWLSRPILLQFGGCTYATSAWLNGVLVGQHEGGYTPFSFPAGVAARAGSNRLVLRIVDPMPDGTVDGLRLAAVPTSKESWYGGYGGPWAGVWLERVPDVYVNHVQVRPLPESRRAEVLVQVVAAAERRPASIVVELFGPDGMAVGSAAVDLDRVARTDASLSIRVDHPTLWAPERPALYRWQVTVESGGGVDRLSGTFGMRTCTLEEGWLHLNGERQFIKGVLYQPVYPRTLVAPPTRRMLARDVGLIKRAGFNLVRCHLRPPPPGFLALCDRVGLMVYEEPPLAWIEPGPRLLEHGTREVRDMVRRDANHPSVVIWGLFNEHAGAARAVGGQLIDLLARLDGTRPIVENSGGAAVGEVGQWAWPGESRYWSPGRAGPAPLNDLHIYLASPTRSDALRMLAGLGHERELEVTPGRPPSERQTTSLAAGAILVSEFGCGGLPDFDAALAAFGAEQHLADARLLRRLRDDLAGKLAARGLDREFGGLAGVARASRLVQARSLHAQATALRRAPRVSGYIVTQFADAGWEQMAGLVGLWRHPRPALAAMARAHAGDAARKDSLSVGDMTHPATRPVQAGAAVRWSSLTGLRVRVLDCAEGVEPASFEEGRVLAESGGHLCVVGLDPAQCLLAGRSLGLDLALHPARGNFMGVYHYLRDHPLFAALGAPCLADQRFADVLPAWALEELPGATVFAGCFWTPDGAPGFHFAATAQSVPAGRGRITFYQFVLDGSRVGRRLASNLRRWLMTTMADAPPARPPGNTRAPAYD